MNNPNPRDEVELLARKFVMERMTLSGSWVKSFRPREQFIAELAELLQSTRATPPTPVSTEPHRCPNCWERN